MRHLNQLFTNTADTDATKNTKHYFVQPLTAEPRVFFEGGLGAASLFEKVEVLVNGEEVKQEKMGTHGYMYGVFNRTYMSREDRIRKYGLDFPRISLEEEHAIVDPLSEVLKESMGPLQASNKKASTGKILRFGLDGKKYYYRAAPLILRALSSSTLKRIFLLLRNLAL